MSMPDFEELAQAVLAAAEMDNQAQEEVTRLSVVYARAKGRVDAWKGGLKGEGFETRVNAWRAATLALDRATQVRRLTRIDFYLARRRQRAASEAAA